MLKAIALSLATAVAAVAVTATIVAPVAADCGVCSLVPPPVVLPDLPHDCYTCG